LSPTGWRAWSTSRGRVGRPRSRWSRWRRWWSPRWRRPQERDALVAGLDGQAVGPVQVDDRTDLADLRAQAHRADTFKLSADPLFIEKVYDVVGLYLNPPESAVVLCVDEKSQIQALARAQPVLPMMPGMPERRTHDYARNGITSLFAAFNIADGTVISALHRRHRAVEFKKFLARIDAEVPAQLDVHVVCDNYGTHKTPAVNTWLARHPRFHVHFTPTSSSWVNQVERWFAYITDELIRRGSHASVQALEADIRTWVDAWNNDPKPFVWTKTAEQILQSLGRLLTRISGAGH
jgi:transposase